ncbi:MAG: hypothetical protein U0V48_01495 [Anaerolineales bacterium]
MTAQPGDGIVISSVGMNPAYIPPRRQAPARGSKRDDHLQDERARWWSCPNVVTTEIFRDFTRGQRQSAKVSSGLRASQHKNKTPSVMKIADGFFAKLDGVVVIVVG